MEKKLIEKLKNELAGRDSAMVEITAEEAALIISALSKKSKQPLSKEMIKVICNSRNISLDATT